MVYNSKDFINLLDMSSPSAHDRGFAPLIDKSFFLRYRKVKQNSYHEAKPNIYREPEENIYLLISP